MELTKNEMILFEAMTRFDFKNKRAPSYRELAEESGKSRGWVEKYIPRLIRKGVIEQDVVDDRAISKSLRIVEKQK